MRILDDAGQDVATSETCDVLESRLVCVPLRRLDCCLITDGGGVVILSNSERERDARKKPVRVLGAGESQTRWVLSQAADITVAPGVVSGREALGMAGVSPQQVDFLQPGDGQAHNRG